jgi:AraC-like DNA-binding protein
MTDDLTPLLDGVRVTTTLFGMADLPRDWGVDFPASRGGAYFHVVCGGDGWLHVATAPPRRVGPGDVALLAHGTAHRITGTSEGVARVRFDPVQWIPNVINGRRDSTPTEMTLICAAIEARGRTRPALLELMPEVLVVPAGDGRAAPLGLTVETLQRESASGTAGREVVLARLGDALLVQLVRWWLQQRGDQSSVTAFSDLQIGPVLRAIHENLARTWTITEMACMASLSRSRYVERFRELVGVAPGRYVSVLRLDTARDLLTQGRSIREVSRSTGYTSEQAFSRAFSRHHGMPPSHVAGRFVGRHATSGRQRGSSKDA